MKFPNLKNLYSIEIETINKNYNLNTTSLQPLSGTYYPDYPDKFLTNGRAIVIMSSLVSFLIALGSIVNLISLFVEVQFYIDVRAVRNYIEDKQLESNWTKNNVNKLSNVVWELKKLAKEEFIEEKVEIDLKKIEIRCKQLYRK